MVVLWSRGCLPSSSVPAPGSQLVSRPRLLDRLGPLRTLTLVFAPAGFGETTLSQNGSHTTGDLNQSPDKERRDVTRALFDQLLWPAITVAGDVHAANPLLRSFTAVVHGYAYLPRGGFTRGFPTDMRGFPTETDLVADEAARAVRTLTHATAERIPGV
jgi:hypothetical protein